MHETTKEIAQKEKRKGQQIENEDLQIKEVKDNSTNIKIKTTKKEIWMEIR